MSATSRSTAGSPPELLDILVASGATVGAVIPGLAALGPTRLGQPLPPRIVRSLASAQIASWEQISTLAVADLLEIAGIGPSAATAILASGLDLASDWSAGAAVVAEADLIASVVDIAVRDPRQRSILSERILAAARPGTVGDLAERFSVSHERVRQIERKIVAQLRTIPNRTEVQPLAGLVSTLFDEAGSAIPQKEMTSIKLFGRSLGATTPDASDDNEIAALVVRWLAGPYRLRDGWFVSEQAQDVVAGLERRLLSIADSAGVIDPAKAAGQLNQAGLRPPFHSQWLESTDIVRRVEGNLVRWDGTFADRAERLLRITGSPLDAHALAALLLDSLTPQNLRQYLSQDERFVRVTKTQFALTEWRPEAYTSIADKLVEELERRGGIASVENLVAHVCNRYSVSENSVKSYLAAPAFVRADTGIVRLRRSDEPYRPRAEIRLAPECYLVDGRWALRIEVDRDVLRGSGRPIPGPFGLYVGVGPNSQRSLRATPGDGHITMSWSSVSHTGPHIGSIRRQLSALNAASGDAVFMRYAEDNTMSFRLLRNADVYAACGVVRLAHLVGVDCSHSPEHQELLLAVAVALGIDTGVSHDDVIGAIAEVLTNRKETELLALLPTKSGGRSH